MKIATWNINSVRLRQNLVKDLLKDENIDVLCLQETKVEDNAFPFKSFREVGYEHIFISGQKSYNGVCVISRKPIALDEIKPLVNNDKRHISVKIKHGSETIILHNFYIPAGGDIPDVNENPKFKHKLDYNDTIRAYLKKKHDKKDNIILLGDLNIAPYEHDVWSHKQLLDVVSHTPIEVEKLMSVKESLDFVDVAREFVPQKEKLYSWWSYRNQDWKKSNRGRRLDHIWVSPSLKTSVKKFSIAKDCRDWQQTSDHVPVIIELN